MLKNKKMEFWFIVGSQYLYGKDTLTQVKSDSIKIVDGLNKSGNLPYTVTFKSLATSADEIKKLMKEVNYNDNVAGVITWMHTFSPAKMWIAGTKLLQKPLLHFATQFNQHIPWNTIDMDFMNLNQSAHGDREYGFINARLNKHNKVIVGYWEKTEIQKEIADWMNVAVGYIASQDIKVARFGDNMRNVAVTEGDKIEAQIQFGWTVDYYGIGDLVAEINKVSQSDIDKTYEDFKKIYIMDTGDNDPEFYEKQVKEQIKIEIALRNFLKAGDYTAFSTNFEDLYGMKQLPGLAVQRLNAEGYGFAGEGDWKTAALDRLIKIMADNKKTGFMEDYTYELGAGSEEILGAHMLEVDPTFASDKPRVVVKPLGIGDREDPARLIFNGSTGKGIAVSMCDLGTHYRLLINEINAVEPAEDTPNLPVAKLVWKPEPNFSDGVKSWIYAGGGHHTVVTLSLSAEQIYDWSRMVNLETVIIDHNTKLRDIINQTTR
ncbi:MAG: L-arabinose isomerase [Clostridium sp.]|jgi:L-arabinose isomerase|uniref:L-arabinose isomerase n=1 Tax=Clostridium sp. TaxID=1506 RepID=UPI0025C2AA84|nr:L-arabinose isomerase [Clostridium sp.]MCH3965392.1 L-arabinose isomerase [Clostridium sp.]MCI1717378.1 L-arabinose isomerase [Clostridium sp.]MCI1801715.1 L-arabinose isomerase [Clostridium sp.]MCI1815564.1 L-arabinose isomerase [Clostridium sp.]MCI1872464.1 L-arabinose isomerase [Clostridium sp.]